MIEEYLEAAKRRLGATSDRELCRALNVGISTISQWRTRRQWPTDRYMLRLAELAAIDPERALVELNIWRSESNSIADRYRAILAKIVASLLLALYLVPTPAQAENNLASGFTKLHIMRQIP